MNTENEIRKVLTAIAEAIDRYAGQDMPPSLMGGRSGLVLFYAYYYRLTGEERYLEALGDQVTRCVDDLAAKHPGYSYCDGIAGIAWALQHLVNIGLADAEDFESLLSECDEVLGAYMNAALADRAYDFLYEGLGPVLYFIERMPGENAAKQLTAALNHLERAADIHTSGIRWRDLFTTKEKGQEEVECYNLGLAHGSSAILMVLGLLYEKGIVPELSGRLLEGGARWLLSARNREPNTCQSLYPSIVDKDNKPLNHNGSRLGWCYGDLCVAHALLHAGDKLCKQSYKSEAYSIFKHTLQVRNRENGSVADACLCHGSAGIAQLYRSAHQVSRYTPLIQGAEHWMEETLGMNTWADGVAGFKHHTKDAEENSCHLLDGVAGIGLSLIAALGDSSASSWGRCLLLS